MPRKEIFTFIIWRKPQKASPTTSTFIQVKSASPPLLYCVCALHTYWCNVRIFKSEWEHVHTHTKCLKVLNWNLNTKYSNENEIKKVNRRHKHKNINISFLSFVLSVYYSYSWCYATRISSKKYIYLWDSNQKYNKRNWRHAYTFIYKFVL